MDFAIKINPGSVNTGETDLSKFHARGGKVIAYHGRNDEVSLPYPPSSYTSNLTQTRPSHPPSQPATSKASNQPSTSPSPKCTPSTASSTSLGCITALRDPAPRIGQNAPYNKPLADPQHNVLLALIDWVEKGRAPDQIIGTKYTNDNISMPIYSQRGIYSSFG